MILLELVVYSGEKSHAYVTFFGKDEMKRPPERPRVDEET
jgi:hypothetical protein